VNSWKICIKLWQESYSDYTAKKKKIDINKIIELHNQGLYDNEISELLDCSRANITHRLNKLGIHNRRSKEEDIPLRNRISESLIGRYIGNKNPNYKGNNDEKILARGMFKTISKELIRNSNYTCQICHKRGGNLETHHIKPFHIIFEEFIQTKYSGNIDTFYQELSQYEDFININNMVVVCQDCHYKIHYTDNHELSPYRWESATTIENTQKCGSE